MTLPRSSRRRGVDATFVVDDEVETRSAALQPCSLYNRGSGAGPPTPSMQGDVDLAEATGPVVLESIPPSFDRTEFASSATADKSPSSLQWALTLIGKSFSFKDLELEEDPAFRDRRPGDLFTLDTIVAYDSARRAFAPATVRRSSRSLHYVFYSVDATTERELSPAASFAPNPPESRRLYSTRQDSGASAPPPSF